ncbi:type I restriction-modification system subunit M [Virgibacillus sp. NKC19-3]|uniref:type I restriction-modification system subunit M n=1 Tax=Virgibacillus saliphilus TaxID=2831674 RepID=UPI001C9A542A|nr:type I restriction-modification system subunit M [Virgibacillus sp. NKC19-3]MBY7143061.1 type I restriction-modification system subunit M [Virgibacillus sp. NKC19-3]
MITSEEIKGRLWDGANRLRGSMDASRYKDYMLGLMFYKFLSDKTLEAFKVTSGEQTDDETELVESYREAYKEYGEDLVIMIRDVLGYYVLPDYLYQTWLQDIQTGDFEVQKVTDSLNNFERTVAISNDSDDFKGLFANSTLDLTDTALGSNLNERSKNIKALILLFVDLDMVALQKGDVLGDAYEYLIGQFAMESGKKAGEFYTPRQVSEVMARIVAETSSIKSIYDPTVGSGSLLLTVGKHLTEEAQKNIHYYGQEKNTATYNLTRMNLLLHGVRPENMTVKNGDTLGQDWPEDPQRPNEGVLFDSVVMNPPYSAKNWNNEELKVSDPRFEVAGVIPPDSKGDYAFLLHGLFHLGQNGTMAIVLPHGVLFRGGTEGEIRKRLLEKNYIDTIIGLPDKMFTNTGIPVTVIILKKNRELGAPVLMIDASKSFIKVGKQNVLQEKDIAKIVDIYTERKSEKGYSYLAEQKDIIENEYNLNIPRYINSVEDDIAQNVDAHLYGGIPRADIEQLNVLQQTVPNLLEQSLEEIRPGYVTLTKTIDELMKVVLQDDRVEKKAEEMKASIKEYTDGYWEVLKNITDLSDIPDVKERMLTDIKNTLSLFNHVNTYDGYQVIAEIWEEMLIEDTEKIANSDFYTVGRKREPNMVTKGSGKTKRNEQDGWVGMIVPNDLIKNHLYADDLAQIESKRERLQEFESQLAELVEATKVEESEEEFALSDALNANEDGFTASGVKAELKATKKDSSAYALLKTVENMISEKSKLDKDVKASEKELKVQTEDRILALTDEEIDFLVYEKWFGNVTEKMIRLIEAPLKNEIQAVEMLQERYTNTLTSIEEESEQLENDFEEMMQQLVVTD